MAIVLRFTDTGEPYFVDDETETSDSEAIRDRLIALGVLSAEQPPAPVGTPDAEELLAPAYFGQDEGKASVLRVTPQTDPVEEVLNSIQPQQPIQESVVVPKDRSGLLRDAPLPSFTEVAIPPFVSERLPLPEISRSVTDMLAAPFMRTYQAATGQMSEREAQDFALSALTGVIGGLNPAQMAAGSIIGSAQAAETERKPERIGGPAPLRAEDLGIWGGLAAGTAGLAFGPRAIRTFMRGGRPMYRSAGPETAPGTQAMSNVFDLARTYDDVNAGALRLMRRTGMNPQYADEVERLYKLQTRSTANGLTESAVNIGRMETPSYSFQVRVPLSQLAKVETQPVRDYLHVLDTLDELRIASMSNQAMRNPQTVIRIRDMDLAQATQAKQAIEATNPEVKDVAQAYRENLRAMRRFMADGEYATIPRTGGTALNPDPRSLAFLNANRQNEVPFLGARVTGRALDRGSAIENMSIELRENLRHRMENEAVGLYVDRMRQVNPRLFVPVTNEQLTANPDWKRNTVSFYRRGVKENYTTDPFLADVLKMDPYFMSSMPQNILYSTKRLMEMTTTGELAPWFAPISAIRSWWIGKHTAEEGMRSPTIIGSVLAIPQQLGPQAARRLGPVFADALERGSNGWLGNTFGQQEILRLADRVRNAYQNSLYARLQAYGGGRGSIMQQQTQATNQAYSRLTAAINAETHGWAKSLLEGYRSILNAIHNAPAYNYIRRNRGRKNMSDLAESGRHLTGNPRTGGQFYSGDRPIRFENREDRVSHTTGQIAKWTYGYATEFGRTGVPWFNASVQGIKRIGEAYLDDPAKFIGRVWLYQVMPAATAYSAAQMLGRDPNGVSYVDYMMNGRSEYQRQMNLYLPIPGRPAEAGIEVPNFHEMGMAMLMTLTAMDHAFGNNLFTKGEDFGRVVKSFLGVFEPPAPPLFNVALGTQGLTLSQGPFTGEAYRRREDPYDQNGGLPGGIETFIRNIAPGIGDILGTSAAAFTQTPDGFVNRVKNGLAAGGRRIVEKMPGLRDMLDMKPPITGSTFITNEAFRKRKVINQLLGHYKKWVTNEGRSWEKPRSVLGEYMATSHLGERPPQQSAGLPQPAPTNPLYNQFMSMLHERFAKDVPWDVRELSKRRQRGDSIEDILAESNAQPSGGIGYLSLWDRHRVATENIQRLRKVNEGNNVVWQNYIESQPDQLDYLQRNNVDPKNIRQVRNFYERQRQKIARTILFQIRSVEDEMSEILGRPVKIEDLNPYGKGFDLSPYESAAD